MVTEVGQPFLDHKPLQLHYAGLLRADKSLGDHQMPSHRCRPVPLIGPGLQALRSWQRSTRSGHQTAVCSL
eukprot:scaffold69234_cov44-Prasinocladus_malaysianus.AAC.2